MRHTSQGTGCPEGWEAISDKCYKMEMKNYKTWFEAQTACTGLHPDARFATPAFNLANHLGSDIMDVQAFWIGLRSTPDDQGKLQWVGDRGEVTQTYWLTADHQDPEGSAKGNNDCVVVYGKAFGEAWTVGDWSDLNCNYRGQFLCELKLE